MSTHGGARRVERRGTPKPFRVRQAEDPEAKAAIARTASELIGDDDAVIFDNGTTAQAIAQRLAGRPITAMCLSLHSAAALGTKPGANIFVPGGEVEPDTLALPSVAVASALREFRADVVVLGRVRRRWNTGWRRRRMTMRRINAQRCARPRDASWPWRRASSITSRRFDLAISRICISWSRPRTRQRSSSRRFATLGRRSLLRPRVSKA